MVHICASLESALAEMPDVLNGDLTGHLRPGHGTNADRSASERVAPKVVGCGGGKTPPNLTHHDTDCSFAGLSDEEVDLIKTTFENVEGSAVFYRVEKVLVNKLGGPSMDNIVAAHRQMLKEVLP